MGTKEYGRKELERIGYFKEGTVPEYPEKVVLKEDDVYAVHLDHNASHR